MANLFDVLGHKWLKVDAPTSIRIKIKIIYKTSRKIKKEKIHQLREKTIPYNFEWYKYLFRITRIGNESIYIIPSFYSSKYAKWLSKRLTPTQLLDLFFPKA